MHRANYTFYMWIFFPFKTVNSWKSQRCWTNISRPNYITHISKQLVTKWSAHPNKEAKKKTSSLKLFFFLRAIKAVIFSEHISSEETVHNENLNRLNYLANWDVFTVWKSDWWDNSKVHTIKFNAMNALAFLLQSKDKKKTSSKLSLIMRNILNSLRL